MFAERHKHQLRTNKLSQYYEEITRNQRSEQLLDNSFQESGGSRYENDFDNLQFRSLVSQFRENEEDQLNGNADSPGPGSYLDIYKNSVFKKSKSRFESMGLVVGRRERANMETLLERERGPGAYESSVIPIVVSLTLPNSPET